MSEYEALSRAGNTATALLLKDINTKRGSKRGEREKKKETGECFKVGLSSKTEQTLYLNIK